MQEVIYPDTMQILNEILEAELTGVMRYTQYSLSLRGNSHASMIRFLEEQATESLQHAQRVGALLTQYCEQPSFNVATLETIADPSPAQILQKSLQHETMALNLYRKLLEAASERQSDVEAFARAMITEEEGHSAELQQMCADLQRKKIPAC